MLLLKLENLSAINSVNHVTKNVEPPFSEMLYNKNFNS